MNPRSLLTSAGLVAISALLTLLLAELVLGILRPQDRSVWSHTRDGLVVHPAHLDTYLPRFDQRVRTNAWGMRDRPRALEKPPGVVRVLVLGDSFMEALQVAFEDSLPALLEGRLSGLADREVEVVNGSTSGWGTDDQLVWLERYGMRLAPDLVLVAMTLHNDVSDNLAREHHDFRDGRLVERPRSEPGALEWASVRLRDFVACHSHVYSIYRRLKAIRQSQRDASALDAHVAGLLRREPDERIRAGWELTRQLLDQTRRVAAAGGAETAVFLLPLWIQVDPTHRTDFLAAHEIAPDEIELERPQRTVAEWGARAGVEVIDLLPAFRAVSRSGGRLFLEGDGHWNRDGHALAAEIVASELIARGLVASPTAAARQ